MATPLRIEIPSLHEILSGGQGRGAVAPRAAPGASIAAIVSFLAVFGAGLAAVQATGRTHWILAGTVGAFAVSAAMYYSRRAKGPDAGENARAQARAFAAYAPFLGEIRKGGLEPVVPIVGGLLQRLCALRAVRTDYFLVADDSFRYLLGALWKVGALRSRLGIDAEGLLRAAASLEAEVRAREVSFGRGGEPEVAALAARIVGVQADLDALEILSMAAVQITQEARRLGRECEYLLALPHSEVGELLGARLAREKALATTLERVFALFEGA